MIFTRPTIFLDIEATGADATRDRIVEIALIKIHPDGTREEQLHRCNPGMKIPAEVVALHGITNEAVDKEPYFKELAPAMLEFMQDCDFGGFGITRFDIPILAEEFRRAGLPFSAENRLMLDALTIYHQKERRDLTAAYKFYCGKELVGAHGAKADTVAAMEVLLAQVERYPDLPQESRALHLYCNKQDERYVDGSRKFMWRDGEAAFNFGKYKGELLKDMVRKQRDYLEWLIGDGKFPQDVVDICFKALRGQFPVRKS